MKYGIKILHNNSRDFSSCICFYSEDKLYMFSLCDGLQRIASQAKLKFGRVATIFIPSLKPEYLLGLPGFYLTTRDGMKSSDAGFNMKIYGPRRFCEMMVSGVHFIGQMDNAQLFDYEEEFKDAMEIDEEAKANYLCKSLSKANSMKDDEIEVDILCHNNEKGEEMISYICVPSQKRGKFLNKEAAKLGCVPKLHFRKLTEGQEVTLENGTVIKPEQVMEPSLPSECFIINFIPDESYVDCVVSDSKYDEYFPENISSNKKLNVMYHSSEDLRVFTNAKYLEFMKRFGPNVNHVIDCRGLNSEKITKWKAMTSTRQFHSLCPRLYPIAQLNLINYQEVNEHLLKDLNQEFKLTISEPGLIIELYPDKCAGVLETEMITDSTYLNAEQQTIIDDLELKFNSEIVPNSIHYKDLDINKIVPETTFKNEPEILFAGTISMKPTGSRCASCIYINLKGNHPQKEDENRTVPRQDFKNSYGIMMDCSEGTFGQLYDHFQSIETVRQLLCNLRVIYITHMHGDHHMGIVKILCERDTAIQTFFDDEFVSQNYDNLSIYVIIPFFMERWILMGTEHIKHKHLIKIIPSKVLNPEPEGFYYLDDPYPVNECIPRPRAKCESRTNEECAKLIEAMEANRSEDVTELHRVLNDQLGIKRIYAVEAFHCYEAFGCMLEADDWRIFYSGDTKPNQNYLNYGSGTTLLIHEATFENSLEKDAEMKCHTTTGQAINVGINIGAWRTCLTHFSPRYKVAELTEDHFKYNVMSSMDHLRLKLSDFEWAYRTLEMFNLFADEE